MAFDQQDQTRVLLTIQDVETVGNFIMLVSEYSRQTTATYLQTIYFLKKKTKTKCLAKIVAATRLGKRDALYVKRNGARIA